MGKMSSTLLIIGGLALAGVAYYSYKRRQLHAKKSPQEALDEFVAAIHPSDIETVDQLQMLDVVNYFKGLHLKQGEHVPFLAKTNRDTATVYILGVYEESSEEFKDFKVIAPKTVDDKVLEVIGNERLVVLQ